MQPHDLRQYVKHLANVVGFDRCGVAPAEAIGRAAYLRSWLDSGRAGAMAFMHRHFEQRADPRALLRGARSVVMVGLLYDQPMPGRPDEDPGPRGRVAMYAWGRDYHAVVKAKLFAMADRMRDRLAEPFEARACVDTAPLLERELAASAGIGWIGKNTMVLDPQLGSYFFLGALVTTLEIEPDDPVPDRCGTCTACLDACPTKAFPKPYEMNASRCVSYLTIEHRDEIPQEFHKLMGDWIFGCDVCQEVCPYNHGAPFTNDESLAVRPPAPTPLLNEVLSWSIDDYRVQLRGSAMKRARLDMLQRNARIARANVTRRTAHD